MFHDFFARSELLFLPLIALGIFFVTFIMVVAHVIVGMRNGPLLKHVAALPLDDEGERNYRADGEAPSS